MEELDFKSFLEESKTPEGRKKQAVDSQKYLRSTDGQDEDDILADDELDLDHY